MIPEENPQVYRYAWGNNPKRATMKGRLCVIEAVGGKLTVLIRFLDDGERGPVSRRALRRVDDPLAGKVVTLPLGAVTTVLDPASPVTHHVVLDDGRRGEVVDRVLRDLPPTHRRKDLYR